MTRHHLSYCDCERCHPSNEVLEFLVDEHIQEPLDAETLYSRRKKQELRVIIELCVWLRADSQPTLQFGRSAPTDEALTVVRNILNRFENHGDFFTHPEIQIIFYWRDCKAKAGDPICPVLSLMIAGILTPYAVDEELRTRATKALRGKRRDIDQKRTSELHQVVRLLVANDAAKRMSAALVQGTLFIYEPSNHATAQLPSSGPPTSVPLSIENSDGNPCHYEPNVIETHGPPAQNNAMEIRSVEVRMRQLEHDNRLLRDKMGRLRDEQARLQEKQHLLEQELIYLREDSRCAKQCLRDTLEILRKPWPGNGAQW
ncbi:uncharacterized protein N7482_006581 [Penicillium canariense]|uniref:Uncharacterized protein n=1 Tax=Penicillium canariense TaxID=189055 RepID=A0A9W9HV95_9EURO|nr:uncharacterized protein N7482_006581 [Penicillium canariense]KAJ5159577.1 hypothetical protein N7482_006581 [Penicillium canariense]